MNKNLDLAKIFAFCDKEGKQYLNINDIKMAFVVAFGRKPTKFELRDLMQDETGENLNATKLKYDEFEGIFARACRKVDENEEIRNVFSAFDTHCRGLLTEGDLIAAFRKAAPHLKEHSVREVLRELDSDSDGRLSFRDFDFVMKYSSRD